MLLTFQCHIYTYKYNTIIFLRRRSCSSVISITWQNDMSWPTLAARKQLTNWCHKLIARGVIGVGLFGQAVQQPVVVAHRLLAAAGQCVHIVTVGPLAGGELEARVLLGCHLHHVVEWYVPGNKQTTIGALQTTPRGWFGFLHKGSPPAPIAIHLSPILYSSHSALIFSLQSVHLFHWSIYFVIFFSDLSSLICST